MEFSADAGIGLAIPSACGCPCILPTGPPRGKPVGIKMRPVLVSRKIWAPLQLGASTRNIIALEYAIYSLEYIQLIMRATPVPGSPKNRLSKKQLKFLARKFNRPAKIPFGAATETLNLNSLGCECTVILIYLWASLPTMNRNFKEILGLWGSLYEWFPAFWEHQLIATIYRPSIISFARSPLFYLIFEMRLRSHRKTGFAADADTGLPIAMVEGCPYLGSTWI